MRHGKVLAQMLMQHRNQRASPGLAGLRQQPQHQPMHLVADGVVVLADGDQLQQPRLQRTAALAQVLHLALTQRNGFSSMRIGQLDIRQQRRIVLEKQRVAAQPGRHIIGIHQARSLHGKPSLPDRSW